MINQRLFDHYHIDTTKHLNIPKTCGRPFDTILIDKLGSCYACECTAWLPQSIGNIQIQTLDQILESNFSGMLLNIDNIIDAAHVVEKLENRKSGDSGTFGPFFHMDDE